MRFLKKKIQSLNKRKWRSREPIRALTFLQKVVETQFSESEDAAIFDKREAVVASHNAGIGKCSSAFCFGLGGCVMWGLVFG
jgi:hypothetical protein